MDNQRTNAEALFADAGLALMMDWSAESDGEHLWEEYCAGESCMPPELDNRCREQVQKTIKKQRNHRLAIRMLTSAGKIAACFAMVLILTVSLISSVEALRVPVLNFLLKHSPKATAIMFGQPSSAKEPQLDELLTILKGSVPDGYTLIKEQIYRDEFTDPPVITSVFLAYQDAQEHMLLCEIAPAEGTWSIDTENATVSHIMLEGHRAILVEKSPEIRVLWHNEIQELFCSISASSMEKAVFMEYVTGLAAEIRYSNAGLSE